METVSIKVEEGLIGVIERVMKKHHYMTKTEFIRQAIREKINELEKQETLKNVGEEPESQKVPEGNEKSLMIWKTEYKIGDIVVVVRTNGKIENDWNLISFNDEVVCVGKEDENGQMNIKKVSMNKFCNWQLEHPKK